MFLLTSNGTFFSNIDKARVRLETEIKIVI